MAEHIKRDIESPTHQRAPFNDPLRDGLDPTSPGAPHEPGGEAEQQSRRSPGTPLADEPEWDADTRPESD